MRFKYTLASILALCATAVVFIPLQQVQPNRRDSDIPLAEGAPSTSDSMHLSDAQLSSFWLEAFGSSAVSRPVIAITDTEAPAPHQASIYSSEGMVETPVDVQTLELGMQRIKTLAGPSASITMTAAAAMITSTNQTTATLSVIHILTVVSNTSRLFLIPLAARATQEEALQVSEALVETWNEMSTFASPTGSCASDCANAQNFLDGAECLSLSLAPIAYCVSLGPHYGAVCLAALFWSEYDCLQDAKDAIETCIFQCEECATPTTQWVVPTPTPGGPYDYRDGIFDNARTYDDIYVDITGGAWNGNSLLSAVIEDGEMAAISEINFEGDTQSSMSVIELGRMQIPHLQEAIEETEFENTAVVTVSVEAVSVVMVTSIPDRYLTGLLGTVVYLENSTVYTQTAFMPFDHATSQGAAASQLSAVVAKLDPATATSQCAEDCRTKNDEKDRTCIQNTLSLVMVCIGTGIVMPPAAVYCVVGTLSHLISCVGNADRRYNQCMFYCSICPETPTPEPTSTPTVTRTPLPATLTPTPGPSATPTDCDPSWTPYECACVRAGASIEVCRSCRSLGCDICCLTCVGGDCEYCIALATMNLGPCTLCSPPEEPCEE